ncbi:hypothetical protein FHX64_002400 [Microbacter margulisiae]|uniref:Uncharacterized protein n=1 Tax=Microbacter margulisiae TaxID=1350067 RepID=A0A7W5DSE0_9PORP|nr:hypothetical protein [Microbacter margulisiae]
MNVFFNIPIAIEQGIARQIEGLKVRGFEVITSLISRHFVIQ